jgi:PD-(D/E)XK nuclease superfamily
VTFSYTQIAQYLRCPRSYRCRYLDGWREREDRASLLFGRCFETALGAFFRREDCSVELFQQWSKHRDSPLRYSKFDNWDGMLRQGIQLLERFAQDKRVRVLRPQRNLQVKLARVLPSGHEFVGYVDAIGTLDGQQCLLEWKTTSARYPEQPQGLLTLDPQLICYSWISGIPDVALVAFLRKRPPEIQYLRTTISEEQRREFGWLVEGVVGRIASGQFPGHSGIRFPRSGCTSCAHLGLCLGDPQLVAANLIRQPGASDLDWLNQLDD